MIYVPEGYIDSYDYKSEEGQVTIAIYQPYTAHMADVESGRIMTDFSDSGAAGIAGDRFDAIVGIASMVEEKFNPLYSKLYEGHRRVAVVKYTNSGKYRVSVKMNFYFGNDRRRCYYVQKQ